MVPSKSLKGQLRVVHFNRDISAIYRSARASNAMFGIKCLRQHSMPISAFCIGIKKKLYGKLQKHADFGI
jgi:hypothetical protein